MKKLRILTPLLLVLAILFLSSGCYIVSGQKMKNVKGTYELTSYSRTNGKTNAVTNYMEVNGYKAYLVVTGTSEGYYVYLDNNTAPTYRKITLTYEYNTEDSTKVDYVIYRFDGSDEQRLGVTKDNLTYSRVPIKLSDSIYSDGYSMSWKRVSSALDLSYAEKQLGTLTEFTITQEEVV